MRPADAVHWDGGGNNEAFLSQRVVMTPNGSLSVPRALEASRPEAYAKDMVTIEWPSAISGAPLAIISPFLEAVVFEDGGHAATGKKFVRFLIGKGWLAHWLDFAKDRLLPPMQKLLQGPFWLDAGDPHRMRSAMQLLTRPRAFPLDLRHRKVAQEVDVWPKAVHRVVAEAISPEQAVEVSGAAVYTLSELASNEEPPRLASKEECADSPAGIDRSNQEDIVPEMLIDLAQRDAESTALAELLVQELNRATKMGQATAGAGGLRRARVPRNAVRAHRARLPIQSG